MSLEPAYWPYLALIVFGFLPSEIWRVAAVFLSRGMSTESPILRWVRFVATALLAAVVAKLLAAPSGALLLTPALARYGAVVAGLAAFFVFRRSILMGLLAGEGTLIAATWWSTG